MLVAGLVILILVFAVAFYYAWRSFPIISGFGAKAACSCIFVSERSEEDVMKEELGAFPFTLGSYKVNMTDQSVTGSVLGMAKRKAIYRPGLGCTLVNEIEESTLRKQIFTLPYSITKPEGFRKEDLPWPQGDGITDINPSSIDKVKLEEAINAAFHENDSNGQRRTRAVVVVYDGQLVGEKYADGYTMNSRHNGWSIAKSITAALIGILVKQGKLDIKSPAPIKEWKGTDREEITIEQLLQQTSGLDFSENYSSASAVTNMLFNKGDMAGYAISLPLAHRPGEYFNYCGGNSNILSKIIRQTVGESEYHSFPYEQLFEKLGMRSALFEKDATGTFVGSSYIFATARDFARFGLLYYNNGKWNGEQIFPENWVQQSVKPSPANKLRNYGYQLWLNGYDRKAPERISFPDAPSDVFYADGYGYQDIYIIPSRKLVVVRLGLTLKGSFDENKFLRDILAAIR